MDADLDAEDTFRQRVQDCLWNGTERSGSDVFDEMVARISVAHVICFPTRIKLRPRGRRSPPYTFSQSLQLAAERSYTASRLVASVPR